MNHGVSLGGVVVSFPLVSAVDVSLDVELWFSFSDLRIFAC